MITLDTSALDVPARAVFVPESSFGAIFTVASASMVGEPEVLELANAVLSSTPACLSATKKPILKEIVNRIKAPPMKSANCCLENENRICWEPFDEDLLNQGIGDEIHRADGDNTIY